MLFVDHARCHGERNNSKDDGEGLAGPTDGLIQRLLLVQEAGSLDTYGTYSLGALDCFTSVLRYKCNLLVIGNNT